MKKLLKILTSRLLVIIALIALQIALLFSWLWNTAIYLQIIPATELFGVILAVYVINQEEDPSYKLSWCVALLTLPVFGSMMYLLVAGRKMPKKLSNGTTQASIRMKHLLKQDETIMKDLKEIDPAVHNIFYYALHESRFPVYRDTDAVYFPSGEKWFPVFLEELKKAKHFIFLEYFIIDKGSMWDETLAVLKQKAAEGVEVKLIYDDFGCITLPLHYDRELNEMGIETYRFNTLRPALLIQMNNRDHRKICVIDNQVGFTGGVNLADEYGNRIRRFGYWRDDAIMIRGEAVWSLSVMFLGMFSYLKKDTDTMDYARYHLPNEAFHGQKGYFQPFSDTPKDEADLGLSTHLNLVQNAEDYIDINTPYLILNDSMKTSLCLAAEKGVKVRILTPHIPDKKMVFSITRHNYAELIRRGVEIYEYSPGFNHTKSFVADDRMAVVGSVNTDYRSYYLHFEDGILIYDSPEVIRIRESFEEALKVSHRVTLEECQKTNLIVRMVRGVMNLMAPLF